MPEPSFAIEAKRISKSYPGVIALDDVSVAIEPGEVRAILGKNGAGKSTLIRALTGAETPDKGEVFIGGSLLDAGPEKRTKQSSELGVRPVYQELSLITDMTVAENLFLGHWPRKGISIDHALMLERAQGVVTQLRFPLDPRERLVNLGPAKRQMVEIARAMSGAPKLVILDEPTSSLASKEVELLFDAIRSMAERNVAVLYVSHRMKEIRAIAQTATVLRDGQLIDTFPVPDATTNEVIEMMLGNSANDVHPVVASDKLGEPILTAKKLDVTNKIEGADFVLREGEVLGIAGLLGSGRTELLRVIAGLDAAEGGQLEYRGAPLTGTFAERIRRGIALTPENRKDDGIFPQLGVNENVVMADPPKVSTGGVFDKARVRSATQSIIERMSVKAPHQDTQIGTLSGGNQQKVVIGRWIFAGSNLLLLDEPTRGVDVEAKAQIYDLVRTLTREGKSIIYVSSEVEELPLVCDRVLVLKDGHLGEEFTAPNIDTEKLLAATIS